MWSKVINQKEKMKKNVRKKEKVELVVRKEIRN